MVEVGKVINTHGLRGELKVKPLCDDVYSFNNLKTMRVDSEDFEVEYTRAYNGYVFVKLKNMDSIDDVLPYKGKFFSIGQDEFENLPDGVYYVKDLLGLSVISARGELLGTIKEVIKTGNNDVYVLTPSSSKKKEILIPALKEVIVSVDIDKKTMVVELMDGLLEL